MSKNTKSKKTALVTTVTVTPVPEAPVAVETLPAIVAPAIVIPEVLPAVVAAYPVREFTWNEAIELAPFRNPRGVEIPGRVGVWTLDGALLGHYAKNEHVVSNIELLETFEAALSEMGLTWERSIICLQMGAEMVARYTIHGVNFNGPDGRPFVARFTVSNSYNGTRTVAAALELLRLICLNGCMGMRSAIDFSSRHSSKLNVKAIVNRVAPELERGMKSLADSINRLADIRVDAQAGRHFLRNLGMAAPATKFSKLAARRIEVGTWNKPTADENDTHETLFGLLNAGTRFFRDAEAGVPEFRKVNGVVTQTGWETEPRPEMVERMSPYFNLALLKAADEPETFRRLTAPVDWETAYGVKEGDEN